MVEVHDLEELRRILALGDFPLIGINNRDLKTFETDITTTEKVAKGCSISLKDHDVLLVSESGLFTFEDLEKVSSFGARAVLIGEALMRERDITNALKKIIG